MIVHVGGKRTHGRYLLLRQRVEFPGDKPVCTEEQGHQPLDHNETRRDQNQSSKLTARENQQNHRASPAPMVENNTDSLIGYMGKIQLTRKVMNFLVWLLLDSSKGSHKSKQVATKWVEKVVWPSCLEAEDFVTTGPMLGFKVADQSMIVLNAQQSHWQRFMT
uniref:Uncharacterized protein n=1 Tax=Salix viminalis TaxID=40686 RepID=A0A6N2MCQ8_SALVM